MFYNDYAGDKAGDRNIRKLKLMMTYCSNDIHLGH